MIVVYVAGPFSAPTRQGVEANIAAAEDWGLLIAKLGAMPLIPHANTSRQEFEKLQPYTFWIEGTKEILRRCDACFLIPGWERSSGARGEKAEAEELNIPVFEDIDELAAWLERPLRSASDALSAGTISAPEIAETMPPPRAEMATLSEDGR